MPNNAEIKKAKKELKRVIGGRLSYNQKFINELASYGINDINTRLAIRRQVQTEIESGKIQSSQVESRVYQLIPEYKIIIEKEKEEERKRLKMIDEILDSEEILSEIRKNKNNRMSVTSIKNNLKEKIINKKELAREDEIRSFIKNELKKARQEEEIIRIFEKRTMTSNKTEKNGGYCSYGCRHYREEYISIDGSMGFDFTGSEIIDHYCALGHRVSYGNFCKYYQK